MSRSYTRRRTVMRSASQLFLLMLVLTLVVLPVHGAELDPGVTIPHHAIAQGGGYSQAGGYALHGSVGLIGADPFPAVAGPYELNGGFWAGLTVPSSPGGEEGAPNNGDGNNDGVPDSQQDHVDSLPNGVDGGYVTLAGPAGIDFQDVSAIPASDPPDGVTLPQGLFGFRVDNLTPGATLDVTLILHTGEPPQSYWKFGPTPDNGVAHWYAFGFDGTSGATINGNTVTLRYVDGGRGDADLTANGSIVDPGGPSPDPASTGHTIWLPYTQR